MAIETNFSSRCRCFPVLSNEKALATYVGAGAPTCISVPWKGGQKYSGVRWHETSVETKSGGFVQPDEY